LGRSSLIISLLILSVLRLSAQTGVYSNLEFVENRGQWDTAVKFRADIATGTFFLQKKGFTVLLQDTTDLRRIHAVMHGGGQDLNFFKPSVKPGKPGNPPANTASGAGSLRSHVYRVSFENANDQVEIIPDKPLATYNNYFMGSDRSRWIGNCKLYQGVLYKNIYEGIDLHYYTEGGVLKYDLVVHPGADPSRIAMKYEGQEQLSIKKNQVLIKTSVGVVKEWIPRSYQLDGNEKKDVSVDYSLSGGNTIRFKIKNYSPDATLVIDPQEKFCTFTGSKSDNWGYTATYDAQGNFYAGGIVLADDQGDPTGNGFPASTGAYQGSFQGGDASEGGFHYDVAIIKLSADGTKRMFATYLGAGGDEQPHSMVVDNNGNLVVAGRTSSAKFPAFPVEATSYDERGFDIFLTKFSADGKTLIGSRRIGGSGSDGVNYKPKYVDQTGTKDLRLNYGDDGRSEVILDASNNIYLASCTQSNDFPVVGGFQAASGGGQDGVLIKTSPDIGTILFSSYLGGGGSDAAFALALNPLDNTIYVAGGTMSTDLKVGAGPVLHGASLGGVDGFISIVSNDGSNLIKTSYFGTDGTDMIYGVQFDRDGFPYITGTTTKVIPVVNSPWNQNNPGQASGKQFITKLKPDLSDIVYSVNFGPAGLTSPNISPTAFLVDRCENVYVAGWGGGINISEHYNNSGTTGLPTTANALKATTDGADFYFFVLQRDAATQLYGSFFGQVNGALGDHVDGGTSRFDKQGVIYEAICANCDGGATFPTTASVWSRNNPVASAGGCNEAAVKIAFDFAGVGAGLKSTLQGRGDSLGCVPLQVTFQDTVRNAKTYIWDFGDGSPQIVNTPDYLEPHTYTAVGTYKVTLIAIDPSSCNGTDTTSMNITVRNDAATLDFKYAKVGDCKSTDYEFINLSTPSSALKPFGDSSFTWYFSDLTPGTQIPAGPILNVTKHGFPGPGTYSVTLMLIDTNYCNYPDDTTKILSIAQNVKAQISTQSAGCAPYTAVFDNTSLGGQQFYWDFGDNTGSADRSPAPHLYSDPGSYIIRLKVVDSSTCNIADSTTFSLTVSGKPGAAFTFSPVPPVVNTKTVFYNNSSGGVRYTWLFGDGESTVRNTLDTVLHQYNVTDTFNACLIAVNTSGCADTVCHPVAALVHPLLDVPNAFTPGRFGENGIVKVVGFGITHMTFRIYNRWGQMVFESNDRSIGWDGMYKGVLQPMDVYAYTLEAEYFDGTRATKKGDITLIR
jgi:gliding motility-associated-like protein